MNAFKDELKTLKDTLKTGWDELRVQAHLANMELKDDLKRWEQDWQHFEQSAERALQRLEEESKPALDALRESGEKLKEELESLARRFKKS